MEPEKSQIIDIVDGSVGGNEDGSERCSNSLDLAANQAARGREN